MVAGILIAAALAARLGGALASHFFLLPALNLKTLCACPEREPILCFISVIAKIYGQIADHPCPA